MVLINGTEGIGTGWSTSIPNYNPNDIVENLKNLMAGKELVPMTPWYRGFMGKIEKIGRDKYKVSGIIERDTVDESVIHITELPIKTWTHNYENELKKMMGGDDNKTTGYIKKYHDESTFWRPNFEVTLEDELINDPDEELEKKFKTSSNLSTSNMVCFDREGRLKKFGSAEEILTEFYHLRLEYYFKRKDYLVKKIEHECKRLQNKNRFIKMKINGDLKFEGMKKVAIVNLLDSKGFDRITSKDDSDTEGESENRNGFDYLMRTPAWSFSEEEAQKCDDQYKQKCEELSVLRQTHPKELWCADLDKFSEEWEGVEEEFNRIVDEASKREIG
ncbi:2579_t:CDS:2 [Diversispora eburnea]|uniref:DNA topoisomerase (ATP-hydrolyzing) n=1 Tax=Diversispora eburnea TaxID=1213867 RepID=A0A9N8W9Y1_9GLOM|nr:2579_t:CDS:2 [Diversispora eburnea]